jgi:hypothetical protein
LLPADGNHCGRCSEGRTVLEISDVRAAVQACRAELESLDGHLARVAGLAVAPTVRALVQLVQLQEKLRRIGRSLGALPGNGQAGPTLFDRAETAPAAAGTADNGQAGGGGRRRRPR